MQRSAHQVGSGVVLRGACAAAALCVSQDCSLLASVSAQDRTLKVFDVATFDMIAMLRLPFQPACAEWTYQVRPQCWLQRKVDSSACCASVACCQAAMS